MLLVNLLFVSLTVLGCVFVLKIAALWFLKPLDGNSSGDERADYRHFTILLHLMGLCWGGFWGWICCFGGAVWALPVALVGIPVLITAAVFIAQATMWIFKDFTVTCQYQWWSRKANADLAVELLIRKVTKKPLSAEELKAEVMRLEAEIARLKAGSGTNSPA